MSDHTADKVRDAVGHDLTTGLAPYFDDGRFELLSLAPIPSVITTGDTSVVVWRYTGLNSKPINNVQPSVELDEFDHPKDKSTATWVTVEGVTIVDHRDSVATEWGFHRFIDWNSIGGQIGTSRGRATTPRRVEQVLRPPGDTPGGFTDPTSP